METLVLGLFGFFCLSIYILFVANLLTNVFIKLSKVFAFLITYAFLISFAHIFDYFELSFSLFASFNAFVVFLFLGFIYRRERLNGLKQFVKGLLSIKSLVVLALIGFSFILISLPRFLYLPEGTVLTGYKVNHDSLNHLAMIRGFDFSRHEIFRNFNDYNTAYPRGFHSLVHYFVEATGIEYINVLLPATIFAYAMSAVAAYWVFSKMIRSRYVRFAASIVVITPFLNFASTYISFVSHIAVMPFILIAAKLLTERFSNKDTQPFNFLMLALFLGTIVSIYSVLPLVIVLFGALLYFGYLSFVNQKIVLPWYVSFVFNLQNLKKIYLPLTALILILLPALVINYNVVLLPTQPGRAGSEILESQGNLGKSYISSYHLSGVWSHQLDYRHFPAGESSAFAYIAIAAILFQAFIIFNNRNRNVRGLNFVLLGSFIIMFAFIFYLGAIYLQFKQISFVVLLWFLLFAVGLYRFLMSLLVNVKVRVWIKNLLVGTGILAYALTTYFYSTRSVADLGFLTNTELGSMRTLVEKYGSNNSMLLLSTEDWFQYYLNSQDDYGVMTQYLSKQMPKELVDYIIIDNRNPLQLETFFANLPELETLIKEKKDCSEVVMFHYNVVNTSCLYNGTTFVNYK